MASRKKKKRFATKRLILIIILLMYIITDIMGISLFNQSKYYLKNMVFKDVLPIYLTIMVHHNTITFNEKKITFDDLQEELTHWDQQEVIIHLIDYAAYTEDFYKVRQYVDEKGYRTLITERLPNISYQNYDAH